MTAAIVNNRVAGTRITVWDVVHYRENGRSPEEIAAILPVTPEQVRAALAYIEEHEEEVMAVHRRLEERNARGNPPEIEAMLAESRAKRLAWREQFGKAERQEGNGEGPPGGR